MSALADIINASVSDGHIQTGDLYLTLLAREENIADHLRLAAAQFGLMSPIVDEVIVQTGLGKPPTEEERALIRGRFDEVIAEIRRRQADNN